MTERYRNEWMKNKSIKQVLIESQMDTLNKEQQLLLENVVTSFAISNGYGINIVHPLSYDFEELSEDKEEEEIKKQECQFNEFRNECINIQNDEGLKNYDGMYSEEHYELRDKNSLNKLANSMSSTFHPGTLRREEIIFASAVKIAKKEIGIPDYMLYCDLLLFNPPISTVFNHINNLNEANSMIDKIRNEAFVYLETGILSYASLRKSYPELFQELDGTY